MKNIFLTFILTGCIATSLAASDVPAANNINDQSFNFTSCGSSSEQAQNEERALPILEKILMGNSSQRVKDKAMFVLSQNESPNAQKLLGDIAVGKQYPTLQEKAIHYLGIEGGRANDQLQRVYDNSQDE